MTKSKKPGKTKGPLRAARSAKQKTPEEKPGLVVFAESLRYVDLTSLVEAFQRLTGVHLIASRIAPATAWGYYLKRVRARAKAARRART